MYVHLFLLLIVNIFGTEFGSGDDCENDDWKEWTECKGCLLKSQRVCNANQEIIQSKECSPGKFFFKYLLLFIK